MLRELHESALRLVHETQYEAPATQLPPDGKPPILAAFRQSRDGESRQSETKRSQQDAGGTLA